MQHLPGCLVITHFFLDVPAKGKDARPVQASRKVSEGAVGVTVLNRNGLQWEVFSEIFYLGDLRYR